MKTPETIGDVIRLGAVDLRVECQACAHAAEKSVYSRALDDDRLRLEDLRKRLRCGRCGASEPIVGPHFPKPRYGGYPTTWGLQSAPVATVIDETGKAR
jgi:hypothetical protein